MDICKFAANRTRLAVTFTTHGHRLDDELMSALTGSVHFIRISMDGVGETYEALRGRPFSTLVKRLHEVKALAPIGINFVVNSLTLPDLDAAIRLASEVGATEFLLLPEQASTGSAGIHQRTARDLIRWVGTYQGTVPLAVSEIGATGLPTCYPFKQDNSLQS